MAILERLTRTLALLVLLALAGCAGWLPTGSDSASKTATSPRSDTSGATPATLVALPPIEERQEIKEPAQLARPIDLTVPQDDLWQRIRNGFAMPNLDNPLVENRQAWYLGQPEYLHRMVERSRRYLYHIVEELEKRNMPTELALLPMVESAFNPMAYSRSRAAGLWQFIPSTGKNYHLQQNWWYDGRRDIVASTNAALDYLQFLYQMHGDWQLVLASYNWGENAVTRAIEKNKAKGLPTDYSSLVMPGETRYYVPKLQALKNIIANPAAFGVVLDPIPNLPYFVTVARTQDMDIRIAAKLAEMPVDDLIALNPGHNRPVITNKVSSMLLLPADRVEIFTTNLENHDEPFSSWQTYVMKSGDKLETIAAKHGITLARLKQVNGISGRMKVGPGQALLVPVKGSLAAKEPLPALFQPPLVHAPRARKVTYTVKKGDTLYSIAKRYRVSVADLQYWNAVDSPAAGQRLKIHLPARKAAPKKRVSSAATTQKVAVR